MKNVVLLVDAHSSKSVKTEIMPRNKNVLPNVLLTLAGAGIIYVLVRHRKRIFTRLQKALDFRNALRNQKIEVVTTPARCREIVNELKRDCQYYKVLGFDCEWVTVGGSRRPVSLLQLASHSGLCGLFRLNALQSIPPELRELLQDDDILKVGVVPQEDARALAKEYGVTVASTLDLRYLAVAANRKPLGLSKMSHDLLNIHLDKDWRISCSDWEASELSERQLKYAASDAHVAVEMFKILEKEILPRRIFQSRLNRWNDIWNLCEPYLDYKFSGNGTVVPGSNSTRKLKSGSSSKTQMIDGKPSSRSLSTRSKALYDNCFLEAPDGELLCTCDKKKSDWYIQQNLGKLVSDYPYTVRLNFEPAGRAVGEAGKYYQLAKENKCVVCGRDDAYIRKNVVPREYRKHFPVVMKSHTSHDVLLLCPACHQRSNMSDLIVRQKLGHMCDAPLPNDERGQKFKEIPKLRNLKSAARALLYHSHEIPEAKKEILKNIVLENYPNETEVTENLLNQVVDISIMEEVDGYESHGEKVIKDFTNKFGGLVELEKIWRQHFVDVMRPKYLPTYWSINHNMDRLEVRLNEGRIQDADVKVAGLKTTTNDPEDICELLT